MECRKEGYFITGDALGEGQGREGNKVEVLRRRREHSPVEHDLTRAGLEHNILVARQT